MGVKYKTALCVMCKRSVKVLSCMPFISATLSKPCPDLRKKKGQKLTPLCQDCYAGLYIAGGVDVSAEVSKC